MSAQDVSSLLVAALAAVLQEDDAGARTLVAMVPGSELRPAVLGLLGVLGQALDDLSPLTLDELVERIRASLLARRGGEAR